MPAGGVETEVGWAAGALGEKGAGIGASRREEVEVELRWRY